MARIGETWHGGDTGCVVGGRGGEVPGGVGGRGGGGGISGDGKPSKKGYYSG